MEGLGGERHVLLLVGDTEEGHTMPNTVYTMKLLGLQKKPRQNKVGNCMLLALRL